jgi:hypothetical protein
MKKLSLLVFILLIFQFPAFSQHCLPEGITFSTQAQIDNFQVNYPGCSTVEGSVKITGADISNLDGLSVLDSVFGDLTVGDNWKGVNPNLITLEGLENLNYIGEDLVIHNNDNLVSIQALSGLTRIGKSMKILSNDHLITLTGLEGIDSLYGVIDFQNNNDLSDLTGLDNLKYIKGGLYLFTNEGLINLEGLGNLTVVAGNVDITNHSSLSSLTGMENLSSVESLVIFSNDELTSLSGLESLDSISLGLVIENNGMLSSLEGLTNLSYLNGGLRISNNDELTSLSGLEGITSIGGSLGIEWNYSLTSLAGLENISPASIDNLSITYNQNLSDCYIQNICDYIAYPGGSINIYNNAPGCDNPYEIANSCGIVLSCLPYGNYYFLSQADVDNFPSYYSNCNKLEGFVKIHGEDIFNLDSLTGIDTINGSLHVCGNNNLSSLDGLHNLKYIRDDLALGYWECGNNPELTCLNGLNKLTSVGRSMLIMWNDGLANLEGLDSLTSVGYSLQIFENTSLKSLEGINNLYSVSELEIAYNDSLLSLDGLQGLINVEHYIDIAGNPILTGINGIENVNVDSLWSIWITDNDSLTECSVQSVCDYLKIPDANVKFINNAPGCNSQEEVELACLEDVGEIVSRQSIVVSYPNPVADQATFTIRLQEPAKVNLTLYNNLGQVVATILDGSLEKGNHLITWNSENLPPGIYFYRISTIDHRQSAIGKLVVVR